MNMRFITILTIVSSCALFLSSCGDNDSFTSSEGNESNSGTISQKNFSVLTADVNPAVIDDTTNVFTKTSVEITASIGDRNNQLLTDAHTINFATEYGLIEPSCVTNNGECQVTWTAIKRPTAGGPGDDGFVTITAYTSGEEGFTDTNGNGIFDDGDAGFDDLEEPFVDVDGSGTFTTGDLIIDVKSTNDPSGENEIHDAADGFFNGSGCTHTSLCADRKDITIFSRTSMNIIVNEILSRTIGGTVTGLAGDQVILQNNLGDDLNITTNGDYTFVTEIDDGQTYDVTVSTHPSNPSQTCFVVNGSETVSANVTNVDIDCLTNPFTIGGNITGLPAGETITLQNNNDGINLIINGGPGSISYSFVNLVVDLGAFDVSIIANSAGLTCDFIIPASAMGNVAGTNVNNIDIDCM